MDQDAGTKRARSRLKTRKYRDDSRRRVHIELSADVYVQLCTYAAIHRMTKSEVVERALAPYLAGYDVSHPSDSAREETTAA